MGQAAAAAHGGGARGGCEHHGLGSALDNLAVEVTLPQARGEAFTVDLPAETLAARYIGVLLARLNGSVLEEGGHPLVRAVEARIRGAEVRRAEDGIVLSVVEIEHL